MTINMASFKNTSLWPMGEKLFTLFFHAFWSKKKKKSIIEVGKPLNNGCHLRIILYLIKKKKKKDYIIDSSDFWYPILMDATYLTLNSYNINNNIRQGQYENEIKELIKMKILKHKQPE